MTAACSFYSTCASCKIFAMPLCSTVLQQPCVLPRSLTAFGRAHLFLNTRHISSALRASKMVVSDGSGHEHTSEHAKRAWELFRSWGSPQYWVAPMVDQVLVLPWHNPLSRSTLLASSPVCSITGQHSCPCADSPGHCTVPVPQGLEHCMMQSCVRAVRAGIPHSV